jgi:hypothetical protein
MQNLEMISCNECGRMTRHEEKAQYKTNGDEDGISWAHYHSILECRGCGTVAFRERIWFSEIQDPNPDADPRFQDKYFPPRLDRAEPSWFAELPEELQDVLGETYDAIYHDQRYLATVGIRTALDLAIVTKIGDAGSFQDKLELLEMSNVTRPEETVLLRAAIEAGNAAAHRGFRPRTKDLVLLRDILESVLEALFVRGDRVQALRQHAEELRRSVPPRPRRPG